MIIAGLLVLLGGFLFIFSPGVPMGLLARRMPPLQRDLVYWGMGLWLAALVPALFVQSLLRQMLQPGLTEPGQPVPPEQYAFALLGALVAALFTQAAMYWVLRRRKTRPAQVLAHGVPLGFGVGLVAQIFTGLALVGAGFQLLFAGEAAGGPVAGMSGVRLPELILALLALITFRPALLVVSAARGVLAAEAAAGRRRQFWLAVLADAGFAWGVVVIQQALNTSASAPIFGVPSALAAVALLIYYGAAFALAYGWLAARKPPPSDGRRTSGAERRPSPT